MEIIISYQDFMKKNFIKSVLIFDFLMILSGLIIFPALIFEIANGFIFGSVFNGNFLGLFLGYSNILFTFAISVLFTYMFSRYFLGRKINEFLYDTNNNKAKTMDYLLKIQPFKVLFLIRMSPIIPSAIFNFLIGGFESKKIDN